MKKSILFFIVAIVAFFIFRFFSIKVNNYVESQECDSSVFVADGGRIYFHIINLNRVKNISNFSMIVMSEDGKLRKILYKNYKSLNTIYTDNKILKSDTLILKNINNKTIKIYDFKNVAKSIKAGKRRGEYFCTLTYKDNLHSENYYEDDSESTNYISVHLK
jgi:hypothetical protein